MKPIRTRPKFRCDFCRYSATAPAVEKHEKICWLNPNRYCQMCQNRGYYFDVYDTVDGATAPKIPCPYCSKFTTKEQWEERLGMEVSA